MRCLRPGKDLEPGTDFVLADPDSQAGADGRRRVLGIVRAAQSLNAIEIGDLTNGHGVLRKQDLLAIGVNAVFQRTCRREMRNTLTPAFSSRSAIRLQ
jgi:hypothetical protein